MSIVLDYTSRIAPSALRAAGVVGVCRYIAPQAWKEITKGEYDELVAAGIDVTLNWESSATDWLGGAPVGSAHAATAVSKAKARGYPAGKVIVGSADFNMSRSQWDNAGQAYADAFAAGIRAGGYRPGVYGPWNVLTWVKAAGIMDAFWQAGMSWAWDNNDSRPPRQPWPGAHLIQRRHITIGGVDTDLNDILVTPLWGTGTVASGGTDNDMDVTQGAKLDAIYNLYPKAKLDTNNDGVPDQFFDVPITAAIRRIEAALAILPAIASKVDIDPTELQAIKDAAGAGALAAITAGVPVIVAALAAQLPAGTTMTHDELVQIVRDALEGGFVLGPDPTP